MRVATTNSLHDADVFGRSNLTRLQLLYWVSQSLRPTSPLFSTPLTFSLPGDVDGETLGLAFESVVQRSDAMRTVVEEIDGVPQRLVRPDPPLGMRFEDLSESADPAERLRQWTVERGARPLDMRRALYDSVLLRLGPRRQVWYLNLHHLLADAGTAFLVFRRVEEAYRELRENAQAALPMLPRFEVYAEHNLGTSKRSDGGNHRAREASPGSIGDPARSARLFPRPVLSTQVYRRTIVLGEKASAALRQKASQVEARTVSPGLSLLHLFGTAFFAVLWHLTGRRSLALVSPVNTRATDAFRETIGLLMELAPIEVEAGPDDDLPALMQKVRRTARRNFGLAVSTGATGADPSPYEVMLNLYVMPRLTFHGLPITYDRIHTGHGSEALGLHVADDERRDSFVLSFDFDVELFDEDLQKHTIDAYDTVLKALLANSTLTLGALLGTLNSPRLSGRRETRASALGGDNGAQRESFGEAAASAGPDDPLEARLRPLWEKALGVHPIGLDDDFFNLGGNSIMATTLIVEVERAIGKRLPLSAFLKARTVRQMAAVIRHYGAEDPWSPLVALQPEGVSPGFYCVPGAAGSVLRLTELASHMGKERPFYAFQMPGLDGREEPIAEIEGVAERFVGALRDSQPEGPYLLGGYSWGGMVAYEMAQQLRSQGERVALLAILDTSALAADLRRTRIATAWLAERLGLTPPQERELSRRLPDMVARIRRGFRSPAAGDAHRPADEERGSGQEKDFWGQMGIPDERVLKLVRLNDRAMRTYRPKPYPGRMVVFRSSQGQDDYRVRSVDPALGWDKLAKRDLTVFTIEGGHLEILNEPGVRTLAESLRACIDQAL
jgi:thioesterase domain-containing protein/acyl carrier protein